MKSTWHVTFRNKEWPIEETFLVLHDKTREEAEAVAIAFGYVAPKWWQFWRSKATFWSPQ